MIYGPIYDSTENASQLALRCQCTTGYKCQWHKQLWKCEFTTGNKCEFTTGNKCEYCRSFSP